MDWSQAVRRNREALEAVVAAIFALLAVAEGATRISRPLHRAVLRMLQPAEAAARRLIVIAAHGMVAKAGRSRPMPVLPALRSAKRRPLFRLFDPRQGFPARPRAFGPRLIPRIHVFAGDPRVAARWAAPGPAAAPAPIDDGLVDAGGVTRRLEALKLALAGLPREARRLVRLRARRQANPILKWRSPLRPGPPPGHRKTPIRDIDFVLAECHGLARDALAQDTS